VFLSGYRHFLATAASLQWNEAAMDLRRDATELPELSSECRATVRRLVAGFCVGEDCVAAELEPFARAVADQSVAACFRAQAVDEARHARFFDRVAAEVLRVPGNDATQRRHRLRDELEPAFLDLFEERLPQAAATLARGGETLPGAVALYHLVLEGIVFTAGQRTLFELLDDLHALPGLRRGVELVLRDERWHIGFGASLLNRIAAAEDIGAVLAEADTALAAWGDVVPPEVRDTVLKLHRRRLTAARLRPAGVAG